MGKLFEITMYCANTRGRYNMVFEDKSPGEWYGIKVEKLGKVSFLEYLRHKDSAKSEQYGVFSKLDNGNTNKSKDTDRNIKGNFYPGEQRCPYCGNQGYVKCGACGKLTCHPLNKVHFKCAVCGNVGDVSGYIESLDGRC